MNITARGTALPDFLERLFSEGGFRVQVSNSLRGQQVNGQFRGTVSEVWQQVSTAFNLVGYYDRSVIRFYSARDISTRRFDGINAAAVAGEARRLGMLDRNNSISASGGGISATGVPAFLQQVADIAGRNRAPFADGSEDGVISPIDPNSRQGTSMAVVQSEILRRASVREPYEVRIFFLRYASANDTFIRVGDTQSRVPGIASILSGIMGDGQLPQTVRTSGDIVDRFRGGLRPTLDLLGDDGIALVPTDPERDLREERVVSEIPRGVNGPRIEVDDTQNALIVRDRPESMEVYEGIITALDQPPQMVEIEAAIIDLNVDRLEDLGIDFDISVDGLDLLFGGQSSAPVPDFSDPNIAGSYVTGSGNTFIARLTALERNGAVSVVSRPQLITLDNRAALFDSMQEIYVEIEGTISRLERINIGTMLRVTPAIVYQDGLPSVRLRIDIEDGSPTTLSVDGLPVLRRSRVASQAVINQGESLLIGGITIDSDFEYRSKVPILGDIPLLGQIFRKRREGSTRVERLFLLTPRIVGQGEAGTAIARRDPIPLEQLQQLGGDEDEIEQRRKARLERGREQARP
ncbi:type III secretion system outer membrane ring subunit SctC [Qipengyuania sp. 6D47A]|uniref:Type III secretion system outer membrane ring subunit SctC n=1 Tax=Qipengyuania qiaonensis TaxID=2867240 RepID=A0ABS7J606_9SPHN|nr:type III secretion system outer membrane ring subunit SctC [Qipengyuania qiaonensis]